MKTIIDVSSFNAVADWKLVVRAADGVIIRAGYRGYGSAGTLVKDARFASHIAGAESAGIPIGLYFLSQAVTEAEAAAEADFVAGMAKGHKISLPVYIDSEWSHSPHTGRADGLSAARRTDCALAFCARIRALGFVPGVYASESWYASMMRLQRLDGVKIWCANYGGREPSIRCDLWQYTDKGSVAGIAGKVDVSKDMKPDVRCQIYAWPIDQIEYLAYIPMAGTNGETVSAAAVRAKHDGKFPDVICNAELFSMSSHKPASGVVCGGTVQLLTQTLGAAFIRNKRPGLSYANNVGAPDWIGSYPMLVRDGKPCVTSVPAGLGGMVARTAFCWSDKAAAVIFVRAEDGAELQDFAEGIADLGYTMAINLDGGGSTACITPLMAYDQGRKVRGKIGVWLKGGSGNKLARTELRAAPASDDDGKMHRDTGKTAGVTMTVTANGGLNLRAAPGGAMRELLASGSTARWYGYYCRRDGVKWLYVKAASGTQGYAAAEYLREVES